MTAQLKSFPAFRALMRRVSLEDRRRFIDLINEVVEDYGYNPLQHKYFMENVSQWPDRLSPDNALIYQVSFEYGENPDANTYVASATDLQLLLNYTANSLKVAMYTKKGAIDRVERATKLGSCMVYKMKSAINLEEHPNVMRLGDREEIVRKTLASQRFRRHKANHVPTLTYKRRRD
jgi:hypothetical protein